MAITRVFKNGNSQAVRIPKDMRTERMEFYIRKLGEAYIIYPTDDPWFPVRHLKGTFPHDFMNDRDQPLWSDVSEREIL